MMLRVGLIGRGRFGRHYERLIPTFEGVALARAVGREGVETALNDATIDAVVIATPTVTHAALATRALAAGKHVLLEKPMAATFAEAEALARAADASGRVFMIGHQYLYHDHVVALKRKIAEGFFGKLDCVVAEQFSSSPASAGVGCWVEMATHECAILDHLCRPGEVVAAQGVRSSRAGSGPEDAAAATIRFSSGLVASIAVSWSAPEKSRRFLVIGSRASAVFDDVRELDKLVLRTHESDATAIVPAVSAREPLRNELEHFFGCVHDGTRPATDSAHGLRVMRILDACARRMRF